MSTNEKSEEVSINNVDKKRKSEESTSYDDKDTCTNVEETATEEPTLKKRKNEESSSDDESSNEGSSSTSSSSSSDSSSDNEENIPEDENGVSTYSSFDSAQEPDSNGASNGSCPVGMNYLPSKASGGTEEVREFTEGLQLLDEARDDSSDGEKSLGGDDSDSDSDEIPIDEIDDLLDEGLVAGEKKTDIAKDGPNVLKPIFGEKTILHEKPVDHFEVLPEGWVEITHNSGMPVYLHKESRVACFARPYWLGPASARKHDVPISAIPCLHLQREKAKLKNQTKSDETNNLEEKQTQKSSEIPQPPSETDVQPTATETPIYNKSNANDKTENSVENLPLPTGPLAEALKAQLHLPVECTPSDQLSLDKQPAGVKSEIKVNEGHSLDPQQVNDYCKKRFEFKTIKVVRFRTHVEKRKYGKQEREKRMQKVHMRPQLPEGSKLISLSRVDADESSSTYRKNWIINPKGKSIICILHEYVQHALKHQPKYIFGETNNAAMPYSATITINDMIYSTGYGSSKKVAKTEAAEKALDILLPDYGKKFPKNSKDTSNVDFSLFDSIRIEDPRIPDLCEKTSEYLPSSILLCCLGRNFGLNQNNYISKLIPRENQKNEYTMTVGKHTVTVPCKNKRDGKQRASQAILQKLHPFITCWGSLLRLYGSDSNKKIKELKMEEQKVTHLQSKAEMDKPNLLLIKKLREEMLKLHELRSKTHPIGKFNPPETSSLPSSHGSDLNNVDL